MSIFTDGGLRGNEMRVLQRQRKLTRWSLLAERVAFAFWPLFAVICLGLALALLGLHEVLGPLGHRIGLGVFGVAVVAALLLAGNRFRKPVPEEVDARLDEGDPRRPLAILQNSLVVGEGDRASESIWLAHINRAKAAAVALRARMPDLRLSKYDGWGIRLIAPAMLIAAFIGTGGSVGSRLDSVVDPAPLKPVQSTAFAEREAVAELGPSAVLVHEVEDRDGDKRAPKPDHELVELLGPKGQEERGRRDPKRKPMTAHLNVGVMKAQPR